MGSDDFYLYEAQSGDTWDAISFDFYGTGAKADLLREANREYVKTLVFSGEEVLKIPVLQEDAPASLPPWKRG